MPLLFLSVRTTLGFQHGDHAFEPRRKSLSGFLPKSLQAANFPRPARIFPCDVVSKRQMRLENELPSHFHAIEAERCVAGNY